MHINNVITYHNFSAQNIICGLQILWNYYCEYNKDIAWYLIRIPLCISMGNALEVLTFLMYMYVAKQKTELKTSCWSLGIQELLLTMQHMVSTENFGKYTVVVIGGGGIPHKLCACRIHDTTDIFVLQASATKYRSVCACVCSFCKCDITVHKLQLSLF